MLALQLLPTVEPPRKRRKPEARQLEFGVCIAAPPPPVDDPRKPPAELVKLARAFCAASVAAIDGYHRREDLVGYGWVALIRTAGGVKPMSADDLRAGLSPRSVP